MARPSVVTWPAPDTQAICKAQTTTGAGFLALNGTLAVPTPGGSPAASVSLSNIYRDLVVTSTSDLSGVTFVITGIGSTGVGSQSELITETFTGPNNTTHVTTNFFTTITSIHVSGAIGSNVSVGTSTQGFLSWLKYNYHATVYGLTAAIEVTGTINYTMVGTLDDVTAVAAPFTFNPVEIMVSQTASQASPVGVVTYPYSGAGAPTYSAPLFVPVPMNYYTVYINSSSAGGSLIATFLQQGIN